MKQYWQTECEELIENVTFHGGDEELIENVTFHGGDEELIEDVIFHGGDEEGIEDELIDPVWGWRPSWSDSEM